MPPGETIQKRNKKVAMCVFLLNSALSTLWALHTCSWRTCHVLVILWIFTSRVIWALSWLCQRHSCLRLTKKHGIPGACPQTLPLAGTSLPLSRPVTRPGYRKNVKTLPEHLSRWKQMVPNWLKPNAHGTFSNCKWTSSNETQTSPKVATNPYALGMPNISNDTASLDP